MRILRLTSICLLGALFLACAKDPWIPIYSGEEELTFKHYLGIPDSSIHDLDLRRDSLGNYVEGLGPNDPLNVFSINKGEEENTIRISGQVIGGLILRDSLSNYHLRLQFKWGNKKWNWMQGRPKDGGILYHQKRGPIRHELQIHEGDVGSYWAKRVKLGIPSRETTEIPEAIQKAKPYLASLVTTLKDTMRVFDREGPIHPFQGKNEWQIVIANPYNEKPNGAWNELEIICWENHAVHIVNGKVNLIVLHSFYQEQDSLIPLSSGRLTLQSEGAELFFKDISYKELTSIPEILDEYVNP